MVRTSFTSFVRNVNRLLLCRGSVAGGGGCCCCCCDYMTFAPSPGHLPPNLTLILTLTLNFNISRNHNPKLLTPKTKGLFTAHELN